MNYVCLARGGVRGKWVRVLGLGFANPGGTWGKCVCVCFGCNGVVSVGRERV